MTPADPVTPAPPALLVCGQVNVETVFHVPGPLPAEGGFFPDCLELSVGGVGANVARAAQRLGSPVRLLSFAAEDEAGQLVRAACEGIEVHFAPAAATAQSLALVHEREHAFYRDLKGLQDAPAPAELLGQMLPGCHAAVMTNVGWTRDLLPLVQGAGVPILTDVQDIHGLDNPYDAPYFAAADVIFLSAAHLSRPADLLTEIVRRWPVQLVVAGLGAQGALLLERGRALHHQPAFPVQSQFSGGAGDTLAGAFAHFFFIRQLEPQVALRLACAAAALKLRVSGSGRGHPSEVEVREFAAGK